MSFDVLNHALITKRRVQLDAAFMLSQMKIGSAHLYRVQMTRSRGHFPAIEAQNTHVIWLIEGSEITRGQTIALRFVKGEL